jgi:hypothetical protein
LELTPSARLNSKGVKHKYFSKKNYWKWGIYMSFNMYVHAKKIPDKKAKVVISNERSTRTMGYHARLEELLKLAETEIMNFDEVEVNLISKPKI